MAGIDPESLGLGAVAVAALSGLGKYMMARNASQTQRDERVDSVLATILSKEQEAHARTRDELATSRTGEQVAIAQASTFGAQIEALNEWRAEQDREMVTLRAHVDECERDKNELHVRLARVERRVTPQDMAAVTESGEIDPRTGARKDIR